MHRLFLFIALFISSISLEAQLLKPIFKDDEFSGSFYQNSKDKLGYVWISTDQGVYRWDSKNLEHFTTADGLPSNEAFRCYMDSKERVWMTFYNGDICYYYRGKIYNKENDTNLAKLGKVYYPSILDLNNSLYLSNLNGKSPASSYIRQLVILNCNDTIKLFDFKVDPNFFLLDKNVCILNMTVLFNLDKKEKIKIQPASKDSAFYIYQIDTVLVLNSRPNFEVFYLKNKKCEKLSTGEKLEFSNFIGIKNNKFFYIKDFSIYELHNNVNTKLLTDSLLEFKHSIYYSPLLFFNSKLHQTYHTDLQRLEMVKRIDKGTDYLSVLNYKNQIWIYRQKNGLVNLITKKKISAPQNAGKFYNLSLNENKLAIVHAQDFFIADLEAGSLSIPNQSFIDYDPTQKKMVRIKASGYKYGFWKDQALYLSAFNYLHQMSPPQVLKQVYNQKVNSSYLDQQGRFWLSKPEGLYYTYHHEPNIEKLQKLNVQTNVSVQAMDYIEDKYGNLLMATNDGVYIINKKQQVSKVQAQHGLTSNDCKKIYLDSDGSLWIATNNGVNHFHYWIKGKFQPQRINFFLKTDGLQSSNIRDIAILGDSLYIVSDKGLDLIVNKNWKPNASTLPIHINRLFIVGKKLDSFQFPNLKHDQNSLQIDFSVIYYERTDRLKIFYRLIADGDTTVQEVQDRTIRLQSLAPNDYKLQIYAYDQDYPDSIRSAYREIRIHILPPFYKTWWFFSLLFLTLLSIAGWIIYLNFKRKNDQLENDNMRLSLEKDLSKFKLEALKAEMNPHFIFNCLNSIKNFILQSDIEKSQYYLSQLSKLIRIALYNTKEEFISLRSELEFIDLYVELEQLRYDHQFDYVKNIENEELLNAEIPTMVLQPFFENAVRHGKIGQLENKRGKLKLDIREEDGFIVFRILDNGIGIEEAQKIKTESNVSHKSMALDIIKERIAIYNQSYDLDMQLQIEPSSEPGYTTAVEIRYILD